MKFVKSSTAWLRNTTLRSRKIAVSVKDKVVVLFFITLLLCFFWIPVISGGFGRMLDKNHNGVKEEYAEWWSLVKEGVGILKSSCGKKKKPKKQ